MWSMVAADLATRPGMPIRVGEHEMADLVSGHEGHQRRQGRHALEARPVPVDRVEVVEQPRGLEHAELAGPLPDGPDLVPGDPGGGRLETDAKGACHGPMLPARGEACAISASCAFRAAQQWGWHAAADRPWAWCRSLEVPARSRALPRSAVAAGRSGDSCAGRTACFAPPRSVPDTMPGRFVPPHHGDTLRGRKCCQTWECPGC